MCTAEQIARVETALEEYGLHQAFTDGPTQLRAYGELLGTGSGAGR